MNLEEIINEADVLVPNEVPLANKIVFLNAINQDFFNVVKIPKTITFDAVYNQSQYALANLLEKDIDRVSVGRFWYNKLNYNEVNTTDSYFIYEDDTGTLTLNPAPFKNDKALVRYRKKSSIVFTSSDLTKTPDAPLEFHWTFIPALASYLANTQDDGLKASNYEAEYKSSWNVAAQNYQVGE